MSLTTKTWTLFFINISICIITILFYFKIHKEKTNWDTYVYKNDSIHFEIDHPYGWPVKTPAQTDCTNDTICDFAFGTISQDQNESIRDTINLLIYSPSLAQSNNITPTSGCDNANEILTQSITLKGLSGEQVRCFSEFDGSIRYMYTFEKDGWVYQIINKGGLNSIRFFDEMVYSFVLL